jgi:NADH:ubiquinone oxidoreductase subunit C
MEKIEIGLQNLLSELSAFYDARVWHFITVNGIDAGEGKIELQWLFSKYGVKDEIVLFYSVVAYGTKVPSIVSLIPSATLSEREIVDMFGVDIEGAEKGLYLEEDSLSMPLRCSL